MITKAEDVKIGHYITFRSTYNGVLTRKFYEVISEGNKGTWLCKTHGSPPRFDSSHDTILDRIFECPDDEVFETVEECKFAYPEEFI